MPAAKPRDVAEILHDAKERGYGMSFEMLGENLHCRDTRELFGTGDLIAVEEIRSDMGGTDPGDEATVFLLETTSGVKGNLVLPNPFYMSPTERAIVERIRACTGKG